MGTAENALLLSLYASPMQPLQWGHTLHQVRHLTGASSAALQVIRSTRGGFVIEWAATDAQVPPGKLPPGIDDTSNPRWDQHRIGKTLGRIVRDDDLFAPHETSRIRLQQQLTSIGLGRFLGSLQQIGSDTFMAVALHRAVNEAHDYSSDQVQSLESLLPHFRQACQLRQQLQVRDSVDERLRAHLDQLQGAFVICLPDAGVHWLNLRAARLLSDSRVLRRSGQKITALSGTDNQRLQRDIRELATAASGETRYLAIGQGGAALHIALCAAGPPGGQSVLLALTDGSQSAPVPTAAIGQLFGLTSAESRLVAALTAGLSLEQYAQQRGVSAGTVRGQIKQVFAKTGTNRQSELVRLVLSSSAAQVMASACSRLHC